MDVVEVLGLGAHLLPDAVEVLDAAVDMGLDPLLEEDGLQGPVDFLDGGGQLGALGLYGLVQLGVLFWLQLTEGQILQLQADNTHAQAIGQRRVELQGLP